MNSSTKNQLRFPDILASSVHDMKNSLSLIISDLEQFVAESGDCECAATSKYPKLEYEAKRLNNQLIQLLVLYKFDHHQYLLDINEQEVDPFLMEIKENYAQLLATKNIEIEVECDPDLVGYFDQDLISGVISNIVNNCFRYAKSKLKISAHDENANIVIRVEDDGQGYPPSMITNNLNLDKTGINLNAGGTGLGLYFAMLVAQAHQNHDQQGHIEIYNGGSLGGGVFSIHLP